MVPTAAVTFPASQSLRRWRTYTVAALRLGRRRRAFAFGALFIALWFGFLELRGLYFPDEGRYAEIPREMLASGDWITPRLNGFAYLEKPPLQYWMTAATFAVAGEDEWTARLAPALAGLLAVLAVMATARRLHSRREGLMAAAIMASSCGYFLATQFVTLDMLLTALLTCALCAFLLAQDARASSAANRQWMLVAWAMCGLAALTKGAIGVALPMLAIAAYVVLTRDTALLRRLHVLPGVLVFTAIALPWFIAAELRNPGFLEFFFVREHWQRFTAPVHRRTGPLWYFVPIAVASLMPWLPAILVGLASRPSAAGARARFDSQRFAACWAVAIFVFFSLSSSKLPAYIMPAMGAVALAMARPLARRWDIALRVTALTVVAGGLVVVALAAHASSWIKVPDVRVAYEANYAWLLVAGVVLAGTGAMVLALVRARRRLPALAAQVLGGMLACQLGAVTAYKIDAFFSAERLIERISGGEAIRPFRPEVPFYSVDTFDHTVPFYLGRTVVLVKERSELAPGIAATSSNYIPDVAEFVLRWQAGGEAYAIMGPATYETLKDGGLPMRVVDRDVRRVVVARR